MKIRALKVAEVNQYLKQAIQRDPILNRISVVGELSNYKFHTSGHAYFALKDGEAKINCVWFNAIDDPNSRTLSDGMSLMCQGSITIYEKEGKYQLSVRQVEKLGIGDLAEEFQRLKQKLSELGYFDVAKKKTLPFLPKKVVIITSPTGAVIRDLLVVSGRRNPNIEIIVVPAAVQGTDAPISISAAIDRINALALGDVIILARGGGSIEELWAFNTELVAQAIFKSKIPIVSAIGHETDFTIADFTADLRAATPSEAAEIVFPALSELQASVDRLNEQLKEKMTKRLKDSKMTLSLHNPEREYGKIMSMTKNYHEQMDQWLIRCKQYLLQTIEKDKAVLAGQAETLEALSPLRTLTRGYAVVTDADHQTVKSVEQIAIGAHLKVLLKDGSLETIVTQKDSAIGENHG